MAVPTWFIANEYFNNKAAQMGMDTLALRAAFLDAGYDPSNGEDLYSHFTSYGNGEGISPNAGFDVDEYLYAKSVEFYSKLQGVNPSGVTVTQQMLASMDMAMNAAGMTPWDHYLKYGAWEGSTITGNTISGLLNPSDSFDASRYMSDKLAAMQAGDSSYTMEQLVQAFKDGGFTPLTHYYAYGKEEGLTAKAVVGNANLGKTFLLTEGRDTLYGTIADDQFHATVAGDLNDGDYIDGSGGYDTLYATTGKANSAAQPTIVNVEKIVLQAQSETTDGGSNATPRVVNFDAGKILGKIDSGTFTNAYTSEQGLQYLANDDSRAHLVVEDVRAYTTQMTIGWFNADPTSFRDQDFPGQNRIDLDWEVYFNSQYLMPEGAAETGTLNIELMDVKNSQLLGVHSLMDNTWDTMLMSIDGKDYFLTAATGFSGEGATINTLYAALKAALDADATLSSMISISLQEETYVAEGGSERQGYYSYTEGHRITIMANTQEITFNGWTSSTQEGAPSGVIVWDYNTGSTAVCPLIQTNIHLDNVGQVQWTDLYQNCLPDESIFGSASGDMIVGAYDNRSGIERFDVVVDQGSWLSSLSSTNNTLRMVTVKAGDINQDGHIGNIKAYANDTDVGSLFIGSSLEIDAETMASWTVKPALLSTDGLTDVKYFTANVDGVAYEGHLNIGAQLTAQGYAKYLNDVNGLKTVYSDYAPSGDFQYTLGANDDILNMKVNAGMATDNDFVLNIDAGTGNDFVNFRWTDLEPNIPENGPPSGNNQVLNSAALRNIRINGEAGNDTIWTWGDSAVTVNGGEGDDAIYVGQNGNPYYTAPDYNTNPINHTISNNAVFAFNVDPAHKEIDYREDGAQAHENDFLSTASYSTAVFNAGGALTAGWGVYATVNFMGFTASYKVDGVSVNSDGTLGSVSTLALNKAIIAAIENDATLNKVIVGKDGAGYGLIIESLMDSFLDAGDLAISFSSWNGNASADRVALTLANSATNTVTYATQFGTIGGVNNEVHGSDNGTYSINRVEGGLGNDVIVLNAGSHIDTYTTDGALPDTQDYWINDTLVLSGAFGKDHIFNFDVADTNPLYAQTGLALDMIDVSALIGSARNFNHNLGEANSAVVSANNATSVTNFITQFAASYNGTTANEQSVVITTQANNTYTVFQVKTDNSATLNASEVTLLGTLVFDGDTGALTSDNLTV